MRVTHLTVSGALGGAERVALECIMAGNGWPGVQSSVVVLGSGPFEAAAAEAGAGTCSVEAPAQLAALGEAFSTAGDVTRAMVPMLRTMPGFYRRFSGAVDASNPDVIHSHGVKTHVLSALLPRHAPVVWHLHDYLSMRSLSSTLLRCLARRCALAIAVSESVARDARGVLPASVPVAVVHNAVDVNRFAPGGPALDLDALSGLAPAAPGTIRIGLPATFAKWKGHETFLEAIARLGHLSIRAYVIGGAVYQTQNSQWSRAGLDETAQRLGLAGRVGFTGLVDDMPAAYRALDVVVHASTRPEPFGLVIAEAMACGRALVAAPEGGAGELFVDGVHALAAPGGDSNGLADAIGRLAADAAERSALGERARAHAVECFGRDRFDVRLRQAFARIPAAALAEAS